MMQGHVGTIIELDLTNRRTSPVVLDEALVPKFMGGTGLGAKILYDSVGPGIDPLSPENIVIFATGPLSGTSAPANGRTEAITKSPLTGIIGRGNFGGWWGPRLKKAGFEAVVVRGTSEDPVYLSIDDDRVELRGAQHLWGKDTWETTDTLKSELGSDISVLAIGPAGENLVRFACPIGDYHHAPGRSHTGCVMGAKKLKAIAVRGTKEVPIFHAERFKEAAMEAVDRIISYPQRGMRMQAGSNYLPINAAKAEVVSGKHFQDGRLSPDSEIWDLPDSALRHLKTEKGYYGYHCPYAKYYGCDLMAVVTEGPYKGLKVGGVAFSHPGFEWGAKCGIKTYPAMWKCRELCQRYGMDQTTPVPMAMELYEKGIISEKDTDGLELTWGNESAIHEMLGKIARREGFGDILAEGGVKAAAKIGRGAEHYPYTVKGMEVPSTDPRMVAMLGKSLGHIVSLRGGDNLDTTHGLEAEHISAWAREKGWSEEQYLGWLTEWIDMPKEVKAQIFGTPPSTEFLKPWNTAGRAASVKWHGDYTSMFNSLGICLMATNYSHALGPTHLAELYSACTGGEITAEEIMRTGERIFNLMKAYNVREGLTREDDNWPERFYREPRDGSRIAPKEKLEQLLDEYYELRGWNKERGVPTKGKLDELGLGDIADELLGMGLIAE